MSACLLTCLQLVAKRRMFGGGKLLLCLLQCVLIALECCTCSVSLVGVGTLSWCLTVYRNVLPKVSMCLFFDLKGFSAGLFAFYRDDDGKPLTPRYADGLPPFNERYYRFFGPLDTLTEGCFHVAFLGCILACWKSNFIPLLEWLSFIMFKQWCVVTLQSFFTLPLSTYIILIL